MIVVKGNVSKHFTQSEYHKGTTAVNLFASTMTFIKVLERFRYWLNQPMIVVSWYRTEAENKAVGGIKTSNHLTGTAIDWKLSKKAFNKALFIQYATKWAELCKYFGCVGEAGLYSDGWIHFGMQNPQQAKANGHKFFHWQTINGKQYNNPFPELRGL